MNAVRYNGKNLPVDFRPVVWYLSYQYHPGPSLPDKTVSPNSEIYFVLRKKITETLLKNHFAVVIFAFFLRTYLKTVLKVKINIKCLVFNFMFDTKWLDTM